MSRKAPRERSRPSKPESSGASAAPGAPSPRAAPARRPPLGPTLLVASLVLSTLFVWGAFNPVAYSGGDNAGYLALAHGLVTEGAYLDVFDPARLPHTKYPPVFPAALALLMLLGARTWVAFKLLVAAFSVAAVGLSYLWSERRLGPWGGLAVAGLLAVSAVVVDNSHWILSDPLFLALTMASLWALEHADEEGAAGGWLAVGVGSALLAYFTRSAGLPLLVAILGWLAIRRRWKALAGSALALGLPALAWWLRGRGQGVADYAVEFWMVDPYQPSLGTVGLGGLASRVVSNAAAYLTEHVPRAIAGEAGGPWAVLGLVVTAAAAYGWFRCLRERPGPAELFVPLYVGLILLWPEVWGGDRFALPLLPLAFAYGAVTLRAAGARLGRSGTLLAAGTLMVLVLPALGAWGNSWRIASACSAMVRAAGPFACYGAGIQQFVGAAEWAGGSLPPGSAVMSRKPRFFYLLSGLPSRTFPFADTPEAQLAEADSVGARYVLLDRWDGLAMRYVGGAVLRRPGAFCIVRAFGAPAAGGAQLLGILPEAERGGGPAAERDRVTLARCPADYVAPTGARGPQDVPDRTTYSPSRAGRIPLLSGPRP